MKTASSFLQNNYTDFLIAVSYFLIWEPITSKYDNIINLEIFDSMSKIHLNS